MDPARADAPPSVREREIGGYIGRFADEERPDDAEDGDDRAGEEGETNTAGGPTQERVAVQLLLAVSRCSIGTCRRSPAT